MQNTLGQERGTDNGFTLVELLIVIVILGVLSTVTVFAVQGIADRGETAASDADELTLVKAQEAYMAENGAYTTEEGLVTAGLLREESSTWDITVADDELSYEVVAPGGQDAPWAIGQTRETTLAGFDVTQYGDGPNVVLLVGRSTAPEADFANYVATTAPPESITFYMLRDMTADTDPEMEALFAATDYMVLGNDLPALWNLQNTAESFYGTQEFQMDPQSRWGYWSDELVGLAPQLESLID